MKYDTAGQKMPPHYLDELRSRRMLRCQRNTANDNSAAGNNYSQIGCCNYFANYFNLVSHPGFICFFRKKIKKKLN